MITGKYPSLRLRRNRKFDWTRRLIRENDLSANDLILPIFITDGKNIKQPIRTMPNVYRYSIDRLTEVIDKALMYKIPMIALFTHTAKKLKNIEGTESLNPNNLVCKGIKLI